MKLLFLVRGCNREIYFELLALDGWRQRRFEFTMLGGGKSDHLVDMLRRSNLVSQVEKT